MSENSDSSSFLSIPTRQSSVAILLILLKLVKTIFRQLWPFLLIIFFNPSKTRSMYYANIFLVIGGFSAVLSIIRYFKFYFYIKDDELIIEKGVIQKTKLNIPLDRIQTINFQQNIIHQLFNVVSLEIDTAGSKGNEFSITALETEKAEKIRDFLISKKSNLIVENIEEEEPIEEPKDELLLRLLPLDLIKIGVGQNHLQTLGIILAFFFGIGQMFEDALGDVFQTGFNKILGFSQNSLFLYTISIGTFLIILAFLFSLFRTVLRFFDLQFLKTSNGFKVVSGLFTRRESSANMQKIQMLLWSTNPIKQFFSLFDLQLSQASTIAVGRKNSIYVPGCYETQIDAVREAYFPEEKNLVFTKHGIDKSIILRQTLYFGLIPILLLFLLTFEKLTWFSSLWFVALVLIYLANKKYQKKWSFEISEEGIHTRSGVIGQKYVLLKWFKVQAVRIRQSHYQRRKDLADIYFYTAAGTIRIPYIELKKAHAIQDFVLYKIETDTRKWM